MNTKPLVSILINNYNYGCFLSQAIDSALGQTYNNIEVIVVDDGSTDNSPAIINNYGDKIITIFKENGGQASAFNSGYARSSGEIICFLDADDYFATQKIANIVDIFQEHVDAQWLFHPLAFSGKIPDQTSPKYDGSSGIYDIRYPMTQGQLRGQLPFADIVTSGMCLKRELLQQILPMPEVIRITSDDYIKYAALGLSPGFILLEQLATQRIHENNAYTFRDDKQELRANILILTAYYLKNDFPFLAKFSNNIFTLGLDIYQKMTIKSDKLLDLINNYKLSLNLLERLEIMARILYYRFKR